MNWMGRWNSGLPFVLQTVPFALTLATRASAWWPYAFGLAAAINLWAWLLALKKRSGIVDTPTSRVASAAQGYVELIGAGRALVCGELYTPHTQLPCLWYRYRTQRLQRGEWREVSSGESELPFGLDDGSGICEIDPRGAEILSTHEETRTEGEVRHIETVLLKGDRIYALGDFTSINGAQLTLDRRRDVGDLLGEWKETPADLHARFDLDGNGEIDPQEWQLARLAAEREVSRRHQEQRLQPQHYHLSRPTDGRPYLLGNLDPDRLGRRLGWLAALHLALLVAMLAGLGWSLDHGQE
jgi:hypothetical protein